MKSAFLERIREVGTTDTGSFVPPQLILNFDQTNVKFVAVSEWTLENSGTKQVSIIGLEDKREMTVLLCYTQSGGVLPPQLVYAILIHTLNFAQVKSMDDNCGEWVECMGVASRCGEQEVGVASGSGWNLWVWLLGVVVRRYIDFLILLIPTPLVSVLFYSSIPTFLFIF